MAERRFEYEVTADDSGFRTAMDRIGREAQTAGRDVERSFSRAEREIQSISSVAGSLRNVFAGALSVGAVVSFGRAVQREMLDAEREVALLNATLRSTGFAAGLSAKDVNELANELSRVTTLDAGDILQGATALLRFREISATTFREASRLAVDLSVATGRDLPAAFTLVGKAIQNPVTGIRSLREVGVELSEGQAELAEKLKETGRTAEAQQIVIDELTKAVGGASAAAGGGLAGASNKAANAWNDLLANIGQTAVVARSARGSLDLLTGGLNFANRLLAPEDTGLAGTINVPGVTPKPRIGQLNEAEVLQLQGAAGGARTRIAEPKKADPQAAAEAKRQAAERRARQEREFQETLAFNKSLSDAEIRELERRADEAVRIEQDLQRERERILQEGPTIADRQNRDATNRLNSLLGDTKSGRIGSAMADLRLANEAFDAGRISAEQLDQVYGNLRKRIEEIDRGGQKLNDTFGQDSVAAIQRLQFAVEGWGRQFTDTLATAIETGKLQFSDLVQSVLRDLLRLQIQQSVTAPLFGALNAAIGARGAAPSAAGTPFGFSYGGARAAGGPVMAGTPYLVGERGPELFVPSSSGGIVPNNRLGGPTLQQTIYIDSRSDVNSVRQAVYQASALANAEMSRMTRRG